jgi:N-acetylmuramoyl-L-alanine amidase
MNKDIKIVIDAGHGGADSGALGNGLQEKDYTLLIAQYLKKRFDELGVKSILVRDTDETVSPSDRVNRILNAFGNNSNVLLLSNHLNAGGGEGSEVIYALRNNDTLSNMILDNLGKEGLKKRKVYQRRLPSDSRKDYYYILRNTGKTEPVIVEYGFIDNDKDLAFLKDNYKDLAEAVIKGVLDYKGIDYLSPEVVATDTYIVSKGDTLYSIAKKLDTSVSELKKINNLSNDILSIGQKLKIPSKVIDLGDTELYTVKKGDTLYGIANKYGITVDELKGLNDKNNNNLSVGELLKVPSGLSNVLTYTVSKGDTLYSIAKKFDKGVDEIKKINNLTSNMISIGDKLIIPEKEIMTYVVKAGDTLYGIANKFGKTVDELKKLNNLDSDILSIGKILMLK